jgi:mannitol-1-/sugar-/sorbitol-6-phosphatase
MVNIDPADIDAVLFDMDGTLVDSSAAVEASWTAFAEEHGFDPAEVIAQVHGVRAEESIARLLPADQVEAATDTLLEREMSMLDGVVEIPGAADLLRALPAAGVPVAIVTSAPRDLALARLGAGGIPIPPVIVTAEDVERGKPAPDCYLIGAERLGADPARCLVFEDAEAGIRAGLAAGARVVVIGGHASPTTEPLTRLADNRDVTIG